MYICLRARKGKKERVLQKSFANSEKNYVFLTSFLFSLSLSPPHLSTQVHVKAGKADEAGEALKVVKAPKVSWQFR